MNRNEIPEPFENGHMEEVNAPAPRYAMQIPEPVNMINTDVSMDLDKMIANANKFVQLQDSIRKLAVKMTNINDWVDEGGTPYLQEMGAQKIANCFGVSIKNIQGKIENLKDDKGSYIIIHSPEKLIGTAELVRRWEPAPPEILFSARKMGNYYLYPKLNLLTARKKP